MYRLKVATKRLESLGRIIVDYAVNIKTGNYQLWDNICTIDYNNGIAIKLDGKITVIPPQQIEYLQFEELD